MGAFWIIAGVYFLVAVLFVLALARAAKTPSNALTADERKEKLEEPVETTKHNQPQ